MAIEDLVTEQVNAVAFVMNYVEFHFNGPRLTSFTNPVVSIENRTWTFPEPGSRDALCALIGTDVYGIRITPDEAIRVDLGKATLTIPLDGEARGNSPEAATFRPGEPGAALAVW